MEKLKFLFTYFDKMSIDPPIGAVSFRKMRITHKQYLENWKLRETNLLPDVQVFDKMSIEETALCTQIDFANKRLGGGVLKGGAVQVQVIFSQFLAIQFDVLWYSCFELLLKIRII